MVDIEKLKALYGVNEQGEIVVPHFKFDPSWDQELLDLGYECHGVGNKVVIRRFEEAQAHKGWTKDETDYVIELWETGNLTKEKIAKKFAERYPHRTEGAVYNKIGRLRNANKIKPRFEWGKKKTKAKKGPEKLPSKDNIDAKFLELLNAKKYEEAAKVAVYYAFVKMGPEKMAQLLREAAEKWHVCKLIQKKFNCKCSNAPFCLLVDELTCVRASNR